MAAIYIYILTTIHNNIPTDDKLCDNFIRVEQWRLCGSAISGSLPFYGVLVFIYTYITYNIVSIYYSLYYILSN